MNPIPRHLSQDSFPDLPHLHVQQLKLFIVYMYIDLQHSCNVRLQQRQPYKAVITKLLVSGEELFKISMWALFFDRILINLIAGTPHFNK